MRRRLYYALSFPIVASMFFVCCSKQQVRHTETILVLADKAHFGQYTSEILRAEGFNHFAVDSTGNHLDADRLKRFDVIVLTHQELTEDMARLFEQYVGEGGNLIAFRPDKKLQRLFGLKDKSSVSHGGYVAIDTMQGAGRGLIGNNLIIHGDVDHYDADGATVVARLTGTGDSAAGMPAVVHNAVGKGQAMAFLYNLPESVVFTRQGNPESAGQEKDGILGIRAMDLFTHGFVDTTQNTLNPADEQMRLLSHGIEQMSIAAKPFPRLWYFPDSLNCVVTLNNDGEDSHEEEFLKQFSDVAAHGASMTLYVKEPQFISPAKVAEWVKDGFEISGHPDDTRQAKLPDWKTMDSVYTVLKGRLSEMYGIPVMETVTNHWFVWVGNDTDGQKNFAAQAEIESLHGVRLDCNYAHYDNGSDQGHFLGQMGYRQGNYTGTGLTMKFANQKGALIDIYQQLNNVYDQQYMEHKDPDGYFNAFRGIMDRSLNNEVYSGISVRAHNNEYFFSEVPLMKMLDYAKERHVPVWNELTWLQFLQAKDDATFSDIRWSDERLTFSLLSKEKFFRSLSTLVPNEFGTHHVKAVRINGKEAAFDVVRIKGSAYARFYVMPGSDYRVEIEYR